MKRWYVLPVVLLISGCFKISIVNHGSSNGDLKASVRRETHDSIPAGVKKVIVDNRFGPVVIAGNDTNYTWSSTRIVYVVDEPTANEWADRCKIEASEKDGIFRLALITPENWNSFRLDSRLELYLPTNISVECNNSFGQVSVSEVNGTVQVHNQSGPVLLKSLKGEVTASTSFDVMTALNLGPAHLHNQSGALKIKDISGELVAGTSFNSLEVENVQGPANLRNQSGRLVAREIQGPLDAHTSFAELDAQRTGPAVLNNQSGSINAQNIGGNLTAKTSFAPLYASEIAGNANLSNQSGAIVAETKGTITARTSFNQLKVSCQGEKVEARNQSGPIEVTAPNAKTIDASTSFNLLQVWIPADRAPRVQASTSFGKVHSDFTSASGAVEPAGAVVQLTLKNQSGDIRINKMK